MTQIPSIQKNILEKACDVLGDTETGLTGSEIGKYLRQCNIVDVNPGMTKRIRLFEALEQKQDKDRCANNIFAFITTVMNPVLHVGHKEYFERKRKELNEVLSFAGYILNNQGQIQEVQAAKTLDEAEQRADTLKKTLRDRRVHPDVLLFCRAELLQDNYFHAVFEATKSIADKIRTKSGLVSDGSALVDAAFGNCQRIGGAFAFFNGRGRPLYHQKI